MRVLFRRACANWRRSHHSESTSRPQKRIRTKTGAAQAKSLIRGRFAHRRLPEVEAFTASLPFESTALSARYPWLDCSQHKCSRRSVCSKAGELRAIAKGLERIEDDIAGGRFKFDIADEDIHLAIERRLIAMIGEPGRKLHTRVRATIR